MSLPDSSESFQDFRGLGGGSQSPGDRKRTGDFEGGAWEAGAATGHCGAWLELDVGSGGGADPGLGVGWRSFLRCEDRFEEAEVRAACRVPCRTETECMNVGTAQGSAEWLRSRVVERRRDLIGESLEGCLG